MLGFDHERFIDTLKRSQSALTEARVGTSTIGRCLPGLDPSGNFAQSPADSVGRYSESLRELVILFEPPPSGPAQAGDLTDLGLPHNSIGRILHFTCYLGLPTRPMRAVLVSGDYQGGKIAGPVVSYKKVALSIRRLWAARFTGRKFRRFAILPPILCSVGGPPNMHRGFGHGRRYFSSGLSGPAFVQIHRAFDQFEIVLPAFYRRGAGFTPISRRLRP